MAWIEGAKKFPARIFNRHSIANGRRTRRIRRQTLRTDALATLLAPSLNGGAEKIGQTCQTCGHEPFFPDTPDPSLGAR